MMERNSFQKRSGIDDFDSGFRYSKRVKKHQAQVLTPLFVPVGHAVFRVVCPLSHVGAVIGKSGIVIKQLQQSIGAKIRVEEAPPGSQDRVITIIGQAALVSKLKLEINSNGNVEEEKKEEIEVSKAQEALIRVFELLATEVDSATVLCRLLTDSGHVGAVIGKGGQIVKSIRKETGCKVAIKTDNLPICADIGDEMVEIEGSVLATKRALLSVSRCLQDCQPTNKIRMVGNRSLDNEFLASSHRPIDTINQEALPRPVGVSSYDCRPDYRLRTDVFSHGNLARPIDVIPHDALHRHMEMASQSTFSRHFEAVPQDALHRRVDVVPREPLYRPSDDIWRDAFRQHREVDAHESLHRPFEMVQRRDALGMPFESFPRDAFQRRIETIPQEVLSQSSTDFLAHHNSIRDTHPPSIITSASVNNTATIKPRLPVMEVGNQEVTFKILCSNENAGGVIGTRGQVIRTLHSETGASINVGNSLADCNERLIAITAAENPVHQSSPAQKAIFLVFSRLYELANKKILDNGSRASITARLVVSTNQIGCLLGKGGFIVSEMRKITGAVIQILKVEQNPKCISKNDQVVQISGEFPNVKEAIYQITSRLRDSLFSKSMKNTATQGNTNLTRDRIHQGQSDNPLSVKHSFPISESLRGRADDSSVNYSRSIGADSYIRPEDRFPDRFNPSAGYSPDLGHRSDRDHHGISHHLTEAPSRLWASPPPAATRGLSNVNSGLSSARTGHVLGSGHSSAVVTGTTVEIRVPENTMNFVYGENGHNLEQLRQISGARIIVLDPHLGTRERIIVISGTPDQTQAAQNLLHAFIFTGETSLSKKYTLN